MSIGCNGGRARWQDSLLIIMVSVVTVFTNLAYAVISGVFLAALLYAWDTSQVTPSLRHLNQPPPPL